MITGSFVDNTPFVRIAIGWGRSVQTPLVVLDTGLTGDLQVTPKIARELDLEVIGATEARIASGDVVRVPVAIALAAMEGMTQTIQVIISESIPLVGIGFLSKFEYKAILDCKDKTVVLERKK
ncbi:hypothetical protein HY623_03475 [Candidatus Uhrbacteria bacterium]|nr:hypothetical protein [Candidatus Uhrbacteria bacterium]